MEQTLVIIKPDAMQRGLAGEILSRLEKRGLKIAALKLIQFDRPLAEKYYGEHVGKGFYEGLVGYVMACPVLVMVLEGTDAIESVRNTAGKTNPRDAAPGTIRGDLGLEIGRNLVHSSDSYVSAEFEIPLFFTPEEIHSYKRVIDQWIME